MDLRPDDVVIDAPIVVLGAPRSGTTFLAGLLGAHPDCVLAREARILWRYGNDARSDELDASHATPRVVDHIRDGMQAIVSEGPGHRLVEKTPANSVRPWFVDAVFPDARFVHITRNGWGCVPSMANFWTARGQGFDGKQRQKTVRRLKEASPAQMRFYAGELVRRALGSRSHHVSLYGPRLSGLQEIADEMGRLHAAAVQWQACVERSNAFGRAVGADRYLEVKLEELDESTVERVITFCDLRADAAPIASFRATFERDKATRRAPLTGGEQRAIAPFVEPLNAWLGYDGASPA
jgi:hypothetical protein